MLGTFFKREFAKLYDRNDNSLFSTNDPKALSNSVRNKLSKLENNFMAFIQRKVEGQVIDKPERVEFGSVDEENSSEIDSSSSDSVCSDSKSEGEVRLNMGAKQVLSKRGSDSDVFSPDSPVEPVAETFEKQLNKLIMEKT